jgi:predicted nucleic acid-binding protein
MLVVADTNIILSAAIARSHTLDILFEARLEIVAPEFVLAEIRAHSAELQEKSGLDKTELEEFLERLFGRVRIIPKSGYGRFKNRAAEITPDKDDWPFFALAMSENCALWSNDKRLKEQKAVRVINTAELTKLLE